MGSDLPRYRWRRDRTSDALVLLATKRSHRPGGVNRGAARRETAGNPPTTPRFCLQDVLSVSNEVAAELATVDDGVLRRLRDRLGCTVLLRGNRLTLEGEEANVARGAAVVDELVELVEGGTRSAPGTVDAVLGALGEDADLRDVYEDVVWRHRGKKITPKTVNQKRYVDAIRNATITFGIGPAGTGKTYLAMALAVAALAERCVSRIILTRPAVEAGERLGFLPGDLLAKVDPYLRPLYDALYDMLDADRVNAYMERGTIEVAPLAFMRGRTLNDSFVILDEAQNTTPEQMHMFLTRLGFGSKMVVTGRRDAGRPAARAGLGPRAGARDPARRGGARVRRARERGRRPPRDRPADRRGLQAARRERRRSRTVIEVELENRSGEAVDGPAVATFAARRSRRRGSTRATSGSRSWAPTR